MRKYFIIFMAVFTVIFASCGKQQESSVTTSSKSTTVATESAPSLESIILANTTGNTYSSNKDGSIVFSYENGKYKSTLPKIDPNRSGFCVLPHKTAAAYIADDNKSIQIIYSDDMGKTWKNSAPILPSKDYYSYTGGGFEDFSSFSSCFIDFPTSQNGYLVIAVGTAMGTQNTRDMFKTTDGGKTWSYMKSNIESPGAPILNMHFTDTKVGFFTSYTHASSQSYISRTADGGKTWVNYNLPIPAKYGKYDGQPYWNTMPCAPYFIDEKGYLPVLVKAEPESSSMVIYFTSPDNGKTWTYEPSMDILRSAINKK